MNNILERANGKKGQHIDGYPERLLQWDYMSMVTKSKENGCCTHDPTLKKIGERIEISEHSTFFPKY